MSATAPGPGTLEPRVRRFLASLSARPAPVRYPLLFLEVCALTWLAFLVPSLFGVSGSELGIFSLFLAAVSLSFRFAFLLEEHRALILEHRRSPRHAHVVAAVSLVSMFLGMCFAYLAIVAILDTAEVRRVFSFAIERTGLDRGTLLEGRFADVPVLLRRNFGVMAAVILLCLLYRAYGAVLVLGWNAAVWVVTLAMLTRRTVEGLPMDPWRVKATAALALIPHLTVELTAYVLAALVGIFVSKALTRYDWDDPVFYDILKSSAVILGAAAATLVAAAFLETYFPALVIESLR